MTKALQHFSRFKNSFPGPVHVSIGAFDASEHPEDVNEAVVQHVVDVVGQTVNGRAAHIFDALSATHGRLAFHGATPQPASKLILFLGLLEVGLWFGSATLTRLLARFCNRGFAGKCL